MIRLPPISTRTVTLFPYTTLFRSALGIIPRIGGFFLEFDASGGFRDRLHAARPCMDERHREHFPCLGFAHPARFPALQDIANAGDVTLKRIERERSRPDAPRGGHACARTCRSGGSPFH